MLWSLLLIRDFAQHQGIFKWVSSLHQVAKVLEFQLQHQSFQWTFRTDLLQDWLVWSPCSPRDSQEYSPTPQFKSINSLAPSYLYGPTLTSIHNYWKNHSGKNSDFYCKQFLIWGFLLAVTSSMNWRVYFIWMCKECESNIPIFAEAEQEQQKLLEAAHASETKPPSKLT